jgi:hypothetical protein
MKTIRNFLIYELVLLLLSGVIVYLPVLAYEFSVHYFGVIPALFFSLFAGILIMVMIYRINITGNQTDRFFIKLSLLGVLPSIIVSFWFYDPLMPINPFQIPYTSIVFIMIFIILNLNK